MKENKNSTMVHHTANNKNIRIVFKYLRISEEILKISIGEEQLTYGHFN